MFSLGCAFTPTPRCVSSQTHNPQLAQQLPLTHERHQWSYARQGRHQPLAVAREQDRVRQGQASGIAQEEWEVGRISGTRDGKGKLQPSDAGGWHGATAHDAMDVQPQAVPTPAIRFDPAASIVRDHRGGAPTMVK